MAFSDDMKHGAVRVNTSHWLNSVHVTDDALGHRDPFEHSVWHVQRAMAAHGEHSSLAIRVNNSQDNQATTRGFKAADVVDVGGPRLIAVRKHFGADQTCNLVSPAASGVGAGAVHRRPGSPSSYRFRRLMVRNRQPLSRTGQRDLRAVGRLVRGDATRIQDSVGALSGYMDYVPPIFSAPVFFTVMFLFLMVLVVMFVGVMFLARSAEQPGRRR